MLTKPRLIYYNPACEYSNSIRVFFLKHSNIWKRHKNTQKQWKENHKGNLQDEESNMCSIKST